MVEGSQQGANLVETELDADLFERKEILARRHADRS
jgi:hypothetical protein